MILLDCEQGSAEWFEARFGCVTASRFNDILTPTGKPTTGERRVKYMNSLLADWLSKSYHDSYESEWMRRGTELEPEARDLYGMIKDVEPEQIGLVYLDDRKLVGCSPDAFVGKDGLWENKTPAPYNHIGYLLGGKMPTPYIPQVQGQMWVCERDWADFMSYCPGIKPLIVRVYRDEKYIKALSDEIEKFVEEMLEKREKLENL